MNDGIPKTSGAPGADGAYAGRRGPGVVSGNVPGRNRPLCGDVASTGGPGGGGACCSFIVPGTPVAKGRARSFIRAGHIGHLTPDKTVKYESRVAIFAKQAMAGLPPMAGAVMLSITAYFPISPSWTKKRQLAARAGLEHVTKKPDLDNILKAIKDGMNGIVWLDDAQVVRLIDCCKVYSDEPRVEVFAAEVA